ncbi:hypothetical protein KC360_g3080 [Hortaea werneckii]|nr:hypothetical protein KC325_g1942 [Hortaea werneckii]KAI6998383.1 hypothetical protein KC359_g2423 [Hortaea werneckii]KAI7149102.1 hypothetical protein KC344_g1296 [Hortaea werneckii]KAI7176324.1 hypothetical protein KC360_g3080 [Hortaea werneckii]KAI7512121.1 hypothetical protein KC347_g2743 [Hortaea werneckii]
MKRKRKTTAECAKKHPKLAQHVGAAAPTLPLLRHYYPEVLSLRQYLAARGHGTSRKRRRKILQYGNSDGLIDHCQANVSLVHLLDTALVGIPKAVRPIAVEDVDRDITVFTQQVNDSTTSISATQGALKQGEIVDFAIWQLFRRNLSSSKPSHILCHGYQRTANNGGEIAVVPGVPGIYSNSPNTHVEALKSHPWTELPALLGGGAERHLSELLLECAVFVPVAESSNLNQLSGLPMCELKPAKEHSFGVAPAAQHIEDVASKGKINNACGRGLSEIRFVRHRMLYARATLTSRGRPRFGLPFLHVLNRCVDISEKQTMHLMKYIFPRQFGLHNAFTSSTNRQETAQQFVDYTCREKEIAYSDCRERRSQRQRQRADLSLPKRLRGAAVNLVRRIGRRHRNCAYHALLEHYCPVQAAAMESMGGSVSYATSESHVSAFCRAAIVTVFPNELWGGLANRRTMLRNVDSFVRMRRYESMSMHDVLQPLQITDIDWLVPPGAQPNARLSSTDYAKRKELMAELLYYLFDSFLIPLIRGMFHVTESSAHRNHLYYFRHDVWRAMSEPALTRLKETMFEECSATAVKEDMAKRALGISQVRLLPKDQGMRPIINLRRRVQRLQHGKLALGRSINSILTPAFSILKFEKAMRPHTLGSALFSVDDIFPRLQAFRDQLRLRCRGEGPLYFAKVDVQACFDTIPQGRLMALVKRIIISEKYNISRFATAKLVGGQNKDTPGFGAQASWSFLTRATSLEEPKSAAESANEALDGRARTVHVNGVVRKSESRQTILSLLQEHVEMNLVKFGDRFYRQKQGIPQGSIVSSLLCSYIYAELEYEVLNFLFGGHSLLLRLIDDFMVISTRRDVAERFMHVMHNGIPSYGINIKPQKSRVNFDLSIGGEAVPRLPAYSAFPYCGNTIDTATLDIGKDQERRQNSNLADSVTVEYSRLPGQTFYRKTLNALKLQMHAMLLSTAYNSERTVLMNLYHSFVEVALKTYHYVHSMPAQKQPGYQLITRTVEDTIKLACTLIKRRKWTSKDKLPYKCSVNNAQTRWLERIGGA